MDNEKSKAEITPQEYFDFIKEKKHTIDDEALDRVYDNCLTLLNKYKITGQKAGMRKLIFHLESIEREREIVKAGINTFVYRDDVEDYIDHIAKDVVKIIELERYEREIPDEIVEVIEKVGYLFSGLYVVFTDYTGKVERRVEATKRSRDPILFGILMDEKTATTIERFYFLGDWVDEYCDLTLDKMVNEVRKEKGKEIAHTIKTPEDIEELKKQLGELYPAAGTEYSFRQGPAVKLSFFDKIRTFLGGERRG